MGRRRTQRIWIRGGRERREWTGGIRNGRGVARRAKRGQHRMIRRKTGVRETHRQKKRTFQNTLGQHMDAESKNARTPVNSTTSTGQTDNDTRLRTGDCRCGTLTSWRCFETPFRLTPRRCVSTRTRPHTRETRLWCLVCIM